MPFAGFTVPDASFHECLYPWTKLPHFPLHPSRCRDILQHTHIDWAALGYDDHTIDELVEFLLRIIQSMVIAPPEPPRSSAELRAYLRRWIGPALT